jgi:hypothetical protein
VSFAESLSDAQTDKICRRRGGTTREAIHDLV